MRSFDFDFLIDGEPILAPDAGVQMMREDVESEASGMDERGVHHRFVLRQRLKRWTLHYSLLTGQEVRYLRGLFEGKETVTVRYQELDGSYVNCLAWCGAERTALANKQQDLWKDFTLTISEC